MMNRRQFIRSVAAACGISLLPRSIAAGLSDSKRPNVLFIAIDDMADWAGCLNGHPDVKTPNIDRLAERGMLFTNAHCVSPICGPSRAAVFTGMRPETTGVYHNRGNYTNYAPDAVAMPKHFMNNAYHVMGAGKLIHPTGNVVPEAFHEYGPDTGCVGGPFTPEELATKNMDPTYTVKRGKIDVVLPMNGISTIDRPTNQFSTFDWGPVNLDDDDMPDGKIAKWAVERLHQNHTKPFFLAAGFYRPHQPFFVPKKYFDMYPLDDVSLPATIAGDLHDLSETARNFALLAWTSGTHQTVTKYNQWRKAVQGYLASISFADAQAGRIIDALERSRYANNTWIVLWSDHGWHLGEKEHWGKHTPWQRSTRVPLVIVPPKNDKPKGFTPGRKCHAPVSLLSLYPTLLDICNLPPISQLEGKSLLPLLKDPQLPFNKAVVTTIGRGNHSVSTSQWRYIRYFDGSEELYDHHRDPHEWFNLADDEECSDIKRKLAKHIVKDPKFKQFARAGRYKAVIKTDGDVLLFDILEPMGISEQNDVADKHPDVIEYILRYLKKNRIESRHVTIPQ